MVFAPSVVHMGRGQESWKISGTWALCGAHGTEVGLTEDQWCLRPLWCTWDRCRTHRRSVVFAPSVVHMGQVQDSRKIGGAWVLCTLDKVLY